MNKLICGVFGASIVAAFVAFGMLIGAQFSDDAKLITVAIGAVAGVLSAE